MRISFALYRSLTLTRCCCCNQQTTHQPAPTRPPTPCKRPYVSTHDPRSLSLPSILFLTEVTLATNVFYQLLRPLPSRSLVRSFARAHDPSSNLLVDRLCHNHSDLRNQPADSPPSHGLQHHRNSKTKTPTRERPPPQQHRVNALESVDISRRYRCNGRRHTTRANPTSTPNQP